MKNLNFILELANGVASISAVFSLTFLTFYLWDWLEYKHQTPWRSLFVGLPPAIALASILYLEQSGTLITRMVVWVWRSFGHGEIPFTDAETMFLLVGVLMSSTAIILLIRLLTRPRFGEWPWVFSAVVTFAYISASVLVHALEL